MEISQQKKIWITTEQRAKDWTAPMKYERYELTSISTSKSNRPKPVLLLSYIFFFFFLRDRCAKRDTRYAIQSFWIVFFLHEIRIFRNVWLIYGHILNKLNDNNSNSNNNKSAMRIIFDSIRFDRWICHVDWSSAPSRYVVFFIVWYHIYLHGNEHYFRAFLFIFHFIFGLVIAFARAFFIIGCNLQFLQTFNRPNE